MRRATEGRAAASRAKGPLRAAGPSTRRACALIELPADTAAIVRTAPTRRTAAAGHPGGPL